MRNLGKVSRERALETGPIGESVSQNKTRGAVLREHGLYLKNNQLHSVGVLWTYVYRDYRRQTLKNLVGPSCGGASLPEPQFRIMKAIERKDDLIFNNNKKDVNE